MDIRFFTDESQVEPDALKQIFKTASMPFVHAVSVMADVHLGKGSTVGTVVATKGAIMPACVGVDIGCGMIAVKTNLRDIDVAPHLQKIREGIERRIPLGIGTRGMNGKIQPSAEERIALLEDKAEQAWGDRNHYNQFDKNWQNALGSLGGGRGDPGTGKTYGLRALMHTWRKQANFHYITDPDMFFGHDANYMMQVVLQADEYEREKWRVLILEDTGELLTKDAKNFVGQGLSRLLNIVDGLIGQGLKLLVLITTNEELGKLHPAVMREGRCLSEISFTPFSTEEASKWLSSRGVTHYAPPVLLADLYATLRGKEVERSKLIGFIPNK